MPIRVAAVDSQPIYRAGLRHILSNSEEFELVGEGATGQDALDFARTLDPQVMLLAADLSSGDAGTFRSLAPYADKVALILLSNLGNEQVITRAFKAGVRGFVQRGMSSQILVDVVRNVHRGQMYMEPAFASMLLSQKFDDSSSPGRLLSSLTAREEKILRGVAAGRTNKEIARVFSIAEKTVKHHMTNILQKLGARNRVEAALIAREQFGWSDADIAKSGFQSS